MTHRTPKLPAERNRMPQPGVCRIDDVVPAVLARSGLQAAWDVQSGKLRLATSLSDWRELKPLPADIAAMCLR